MSDTHQLLGKPNGTERKTSAPSDLHMLEVRDRIEVWADGMPIYSGAVDESAPALGILWIRQDGLGERRLIHCRTYLLHRARDHHWILNTFESEE